MENQETFEHEDNVTDDMNNQGNSSVQEQQKQNSDHSSLLVDEDEQDLSFDNGKPADFPDEFWDSEKNAPNAKAIYEKYKEAEVRAKGLRDKLAKGDNKAPKTPDEYGFSVPEDIQDKIKSDDPLISEALKSAHKYGINKEALNGFLTDMVRNVASISQEPVELSKEQIQEIRQKELSKIGENGVQVARAVAGWVKELQSVGTFDSEMVNAIQSSASNGHVVRALNALRAHYGAGQTVPMSNIDDGLPTDATIQDMLVKAYKSNDMAKIEKVEGLLAARVKAGRPDKLQI